MLQENEENGADCDLERTATVGAEDANPSIGDVPDPTPGGSGSGGDEGLAPGTNIDSIEAIDAEIRKCKAAMITLDTQILALRAVSYNLYY